MGSLYTKAANERDAARAWAAVWKRAAKEFYACFKDVENEWIDEHELFVQAVTEMAHWRGECRRVVELVLVPTARDNYEAVEHAAERILKELEK